MALAARKIREEYIEEYSPPEEEVNVARKRRIDLSFLRRPVFVSFLFAVVLAVIAFKLVGVHAQMARYQQEHNSMVQEVNKLQNESSQLDMEIQRGTRQPEVMARGTDVGLVYPTADKIHVVSVPTTPELANPAITTPESSNWLVRSGHQLFAALSGTVSRLSNGTDAAPVAQP